MRGRAAGPEGNLDQHASSLLPARANNLLGSAQRGRAKSAAISPSQRCITRGLGNSALARSAETLRPWRMAGCSIVGFASGNGAISRVDHGAEKYAIMLVLSVIDPFLFEME